ncbi:MAG: hypothetical protein V8Q16_11485 [Akkermansia muciniphila]
MGGSYSGGSGAYTIGGDSSVSITAASDAVFTGAVYGGGYSSSGTSTVSGNSSLTLDGGAYTGALYAGGGGTGSSVNGDATLTVKKAVFRTGSTLNASEGTVGGTSSLLLGGYGNTADHAISFSNTAVTGFDIVTMFQDSFFTGNLNMTGSSVLALAGGAGTGINLDGSFSLSAEGELNLDLSEFGTLTDGMSVLSTTGLSNISSIKASFADGVAGPSPFPTTAKTLFIRREPSFCGRGVKTASGARKMSGRTAALPPHMRMVWRFPLQTRPESLTLSYSWILRFLQAPCLSATPPPVMN